MRNQNTNENFERKQGKNMTVTTTYTSRITELNKSFGAINSIKKNFPDNSFEFNRTISHEISTNKKNCDNQNQNNYTYYESKTTTTSSQVIDNGKKSNFRRNKPNEDEKHVKFNKNQIKNNMLDDDYGGLIFTKYESKTMIPRKKLGRFNSFNVEKGQGNTYSFSLLAEQKEPITKESRFKKSCFSNANITRLKKVQVQTDIKKQKKNLFEHSKFEKTIIDKKSNKKEPTKINEEDEWDIEQYQGLRKKTLHISRLKKNNQANNLLYDINSEFSHNLIIKSSQATSVAGKEEGGIKKINQDSYILEKNINGILNFNIFGVLDGHGVNGHLVSQFVSRYIINKIKNHHLLKNIKHPKDIYNKLKANGYEIIANIFVEADTQVAKQKFDCENSGTTCVIVIQLEEHLICANAGDSRAIMIFDESNNNNLTNTKIYPLSYDCKPEIPNERQRIQDNGGTVEQVIDEDGKGIGPFRVWAKGELYPGLAMSRSIGDTEAKKIGVIPNPQIIEYNISSKSKYMIICSDGIWEFISNEQAMKIGNKYYLRNDPLELCHELTNKSTEIWLKEDTVIDDITVVVVFF